MLTLNIVKMQISHKIKYDLRGYSRSQIMTFLIKNSPFLLFMLLMIEETNAAEHYIEQSLTYTKTTFALF